MTQLIGDRLGRTGVAFLLVGVAALALALTGLAPGHPVGSKVMMPACFIIVGFVALAANVWRHRDSS